ncbi:MAG: toll/interleukin-1 receptor domain-containing protein, partial [Actinomycetota bacterium]
MFENASKEGDGEMGYDGTNTQLRIFLSYAHQDRDTVEMLHDKLSVAHHDVWFDNELRGGQEWWDAILENIERADLFLFVASPDSLRSRACGLEVDYASATGRPIVPIEIRPIHIPAGPTAIQELQVESFLNPTDDDWIRLTAVLSATGPAPGLPDPMPPRPPAPIADLANAREIVAQTAISGDEQRDLLSELKTRLPNSDETDAVVAVLERLRNHTDIIVSVGNEIDDLVARYRTSRPGGRSSELLDTIVKAMAAHECTPILGSGMGDWLFGSRRDHAQAWAKSFGFPLERHRHSDLPQVAQFVSVQKRPRQMRSELADFYRTRLRERFPEFVDEDAEIALNDIVLAAWKRASEPLATEPYTVMAKMPCKVYVVAQATSLLAEALREEGKDPVVDFCRWNPAVDPADWPDSPLAQDRD